MLPDLFFTINYSLTIASSIVGLTLCFLIIVIVITHQECHNFTNVLTCNTCAAITFYFIFRITDSYYALHQDWQSNQPACVFRAYCTLALCTTLCYSYSIQAISRLFFAVLYKHRYLLTWRTHWILIIINWTVSSIIPIRPLFYQNGFGLEVESRSCVITPKIVSISMYVVSIVFLIPLNVVTIVYGLILHRARQSTRRIAVVRPDVILITAQPNVHLPNGKRELKLIQNMLVQSGLISLGGILYLILVIWNAAKQDSAPEPLYLLAVNCIVIFNGFMMIALFLMNKQVKKIALSYVYRPSTRDIPQSPTHRPIAQCTVK
jgi:hypothetical protein